MGLTLFYFIYYIDDQFYTINNFPLFPYYKTNL